MRLVASGPSGRGRCWRATVVGAAARLLAMRAVSVKAWAVSVCCLSFSMYKRHTVRDLPFLKSDACGWERGACWLLRAMSARSADWRRCKAARNAACRDACPCGMWLANKSHGISAPMHGAEQCGRRVQHLAHRRRAWVRMHAASCKCAVRANCTVKSRAGGRGRCPGFCR